MSDDTPSQHLLFSLWKARFLTPEHGYEEADGWLYANYHPPHPWKLHVFSRGIADWCALGQLILPWLQAERITHKTVASLERLQALDAHPRQAGKHFTLYPNAVEAMKPTVKQLDQLLLTAGYSQAGQLQIVGDKAIGESGRLFYRYDQDAEGNYRENDTHYKPEGTPDPFV